ncbi:MAG: hypothetical protein PVI90_09370 [Desulfobacteraceae bacterium]
MPISKANANTVAKIALDAFPPSSSSSALFCFPTQKAAYNPIEIRIKHSKSSLIENDPLIPEYHETSFNRLNNEFLEEQKNYNYIVGAYFGRRKKSN